MNWTWHDYMATPTTVIEAACQLADDVAREHRKAAADAKSGRRR